MTTDTQTIPESTSSGPLPASIGEPMKSPRPYRAPITGEVKAALQRSRDDGASVAKIAEDHGVSINTVYRFTHAAPADTFTREVEGPWSVQEPGAVWTTLPLDGLMLIRNLRGRQERLLNAAAAIEGDAPELSEAIVAKAGTYEPLEAEVLVLLERLGL